MFDDYAYKHSDKKIGIRFVQRRDEPMYPWEIAGFLNKLNTVYYKYELLNSICSAINNGISASEIFVFDNSLPLYHRYSELNLLTEVNAAEVFYPIGLPYPLEPTEDIYGYNLVYKAFSLVNSFLKRKHVRPLAIKNISVVYETLRNEGLAEAEDHILDLAEARALDSYNSAVKRKQAKDLITRNQIVISLGKYYTQKNQLIEDIGFVGDLSDDQRADIIKSKAKNDKRRANLLQRFFRYFEKTSRPLVCARVSPGTFRVLGRSLVNKNEKTGLELKEAVRNSPLSALLEGGVAIYQAVQQEKRAKETHKLEIEKKALENELVLGRIEEQRLKNISLKVDVVKKLDELADTSDVTAKNDLQNSFTKLQLLNAYITEEKNAYSLLNSRGLTFDAEYTKVIDIKV